MYDLTGKSVFITGYTGWMGRYVTEAVKKLSPASVIGLPHTEEVDIINFPFPNIKIDYIVHLSPGDIDRVVHLAQRDNATVLFTSSGAVYAKELTPYGWSKLENERKLLESGVDAKVARCFTFAGGGIPFHHGHALGAFITCCLEKKPIRIFGDGKTIRSYLHMQDCADWLLRIMLEGHGTYDVGSDEAISIWGLARMVRSISSADVDILIENHEEINMQRVYLPDIRKAEELGCEITIPIEEAIKRTWEAYNE